VGLLVAAAAVSFLIGEEIEAAAIGAIVLLNALLGFVQEVGAERAVLALREALVQRASVIRSGRERELPAEELVPGDLVVLREGGRVPADARLVAAAGLGVDESTLTGESVPVDKGLAAVAVEAPLADRTSMVHAGTAVTRGRARALVTATGQATELGQIAGLTEGATPPVTPLQRRVRALANLMVGFGVVVTLALGGAMLAREASLEEAFLVGVSVAVAAVPEGLAATVTIALALGARAMAERGAIVRRLTAVETLGSATVVASDKTGTLRLRLAAARPASGRDELELLAAAALASTARLFGQEGELRLAGDPVDRALVLAAHERGLTRSALLGERRVVRELPFDAERRRMTLVYEEQDGPRAYMKGAPEVVLERSTGDRAESRLLEELAGDWASEGLRVLAIAERAVADASMGDEALERDLRLVGLVALHDPLRATAHAAIAEARAAGLRVEMLTGDHPITAHALDRALDLPERAIHARITPAEKLRLVERLQAEGEVVAVTGDGVNDAPALRRANVGVAMGQSGTEAAREAADLVLTDIGALVGLAALAAFLIGRADGTDDAQTMAFVTIALAELALVFSVRSPIRPAREAPRNLYLVASVVLSAALVAVAVYLPALNELLGTVPLGASELGLAALLALLPFACVEAGKAVFRRAGWTLGPGAAA
jgi:P-type Ca2+ transporter type 2C